jgi:hypothetical protein
MHRSKLAILAAATLFALPLTGCSNKLETGYEPNRLGASPQARRAFYAPPFSPEARAVEDRESELNNRRPRPGY